MTPDRRKDIQACADRLRADAKIAHFRADETAAGGRVYAAVAAGDIVAGAQAIADWVDARAAIQVLTAMDATEQSRDTMN